MAKILNILLDSAAVKGAQYIAPRDANIAPVSISYLKETFLPAFARINAAGGLIISPTGKYLFIARNNYWDLPKGKLEAGETFVEAALREVQEETGVTNLTIVGEATATWHIYFHPTHRRPMLKKTRWFIMRAASEEKLTPQLEEGIKEALWLPYEDAVEVLPNAYRSIRQVFLEVTEHERLIL
ncbi:MAG: NUDIX hydrolase [Bacteroides sp.]